jgi:hypothetical protein
MQCTHTHTHLPVLKKYKVEVTKGGEQKVKY